MVTSEFRTLFPVLGMKRYLGKVSKWLLTLLFFLIFLTMDSLPARKKPSEIKVNTKLNKVARRRNLKPSIISMVILVCLLDRKTA